jgi:hypothetical protein
MLIPLHSHLHNPGTILHRAFALLKKLSFHSSIHQTCCVTVAVALLVGLSVIGNDPQFLSETLVIAL